MDFSPEYQTAAQQMNLHQQGSFLLERDPRFSGRGKGLQLLLNLGVHFKNSYSLSLFMSDKTITFTFMSDVKSTVFFYFNINRTVAEVNFTDSG